MTRGAEFRGGALGGGGATGPCINTHIPMQSNNGKGRRRIASLDTPTTEAVSKNLIRF